MKLFKTHEGASTKLGDFNVTPSETTIPALVELYGGQIVYEVKLRFCIVPTYKRLGQVWTKAMMLTTLCHQNNAVLVHE